MFCRLRWYPDIFLESALGNIFYAPFAFLLHNRVLLGKTVYYDIKARFSGSALGLFWLLIHPLLFLGVYAAVYLVIFKVRFQLFNTNEYVVVIFCGLVPFLGFAEALGVGVGSVTSNAALIKNTMYPITLIPAKAVLVTQSTQGVGIMLVLVAVSLTGHLTLWALLLPLVWLLQILFMIGLIWILSSLNVYLRDLQYLVASITLMLMMVSPIAYTVDMVPQGLMPFLWANPLSHMIISYQDILMMGRFPGNHFYVFAAISLSFFYAGYGFFQRMHSLFIDNI